MLVHFTNYTPVKSFPQNLLPYRFIEIDRNAPSASEPTKIESISKSNLPNVYFIDSSQITLGNVNGNGKSNVNKGNNYL